MEQALERIDFYESHEAQHYAPIYAHGDPFFVPKDDLFVAEPGAKGVTKEGYAALLIGSTVCHEWRIESHILSGTYGHAWRVRHSRCINQNGLQATSGFDVFLLPDPSTFGAGPQYLCYQTPVPLLSDPSTFAIRPQYLCCRTPVPLLSDPSTFATRPQYLCCRTPVPLLPDPSTFAVGPQYLWCRGSQPKHASNTEHIS